MYYLVSLAVVVLVGAVQLAVNSVSVGTLSTTANVQLRNLMNSTATTGNNTSANLSLPVNNVTSTPAGWVSVPGEPFLVRQGSNISAVLANMGNYSPQAPGAYNGHFWSGFQYNGAAQQAYKLTTEVKVPLDVPEPGSFVYFGLLSAYDSSGNYDQIGIMENWLPPFFPSSPWDGWYVTWASASNCGLPGGFNSTNFGIDSYPLIPGYVYNLSMYIYGAQSGGVGITFAVQQVGWGVGTPLGLVWHHYYNYQNPYWLGEAKWGNGQGTCSGNFGYTDYEEEYNTSQQLLPNWNSYFWQNWAYSYAGYFPVTSWSSFYSAAPGFRVPSSMHYYQNSADLQVDNEYFTLNFSWPGGTTKQGGGFSIPGHSDNDNSSLCGTPGPCKVSSLSVVSISPVGQGIGASFSPTSGDPYFSFALAITVPTTAACQVYAIETKAYSSALTAFTTALELVYVTGCPPTTGGGGGYIGGVGCNVIVWTPAGYEQGCYIANGGQIYSYNFQTQAPAASSVHNKTSSTQTVTININRGLLKLSVYRQPVYVLNSTYRGWIADPQNLTIGDLLWNPQNGTWTPVNSIAYQFGSATFYDINVAGSNNNYQGNGVSLSSQWP